MHKMWTWALQVRAESSPSPSYSQVFCFLASYKREERSEDQGVRTLRFNAFIIYAYSSAHLRNNKITCHQSHEILKDNKNKLYGAPL